MDTQELLRLERITKSFPGVRALDNVCLTGWKGEVHALVGENGAGKSTLVKILTGVLTPDKGEVFIRGLKVAITSPWVARKHRIALIPQEPVLCPNRSVAANIYMGTEPTTRFGIVDRRQLRDNAERVLSLIGASIDPDSLVEGLTIEEKTIVAIAKAVAAEPAIIAMDEVTSPLDARQTDRLFAVIQSLKLQDVTIIFITHRLREVFQVADRITVLRDGNNVATIPVGDTSMEHVVDLMVGRRITSRPLNVSTPIGRCILEVRSYSANDRVSNVSFKLHEGEILGITGLKGAGAFELAESLFTAGRFILDGTEVRVRKPSDAVRLGIALVPRDRQRDGLILQRSIAENIASAFLKLFSSLGLVASRKLEKTARRISEALRIVPSDVRRKVLYLSGGNQQKVAIGKWLVHDGLKVLIFCEPTRGVDVGAKAEIHHIIQGLKQKNRGIIVVSSELPEILAISDRILVMSKGRIVGEFKQQEATEEAIMRCAIVG